MNDRQHERQIEEQAVAEQQLARARGCSAGRLREDGLGEELLEVVAQGDIAALMDAHIFAE